VVRTVIAHTHVDEDANSATSRTRGTGRCSTRSAARRALESAVTASLTVPHEAKAEGLRWTRGLLRASAEDPALRAVWYRVNQESEDKLIPLVARLAGDDADPLEIRLAAAAATDDPGRPGDLGRVGRGCRGPGLTRGARGALPTGTDGRDAAVGGAFGGQRLRPMSTSSTYSPSR